MGRTEGPDESRVSAGGAVAAGADEGGDDGTGAGAPVDARTGAGVGVDVVVGASAGSAVGSGDGGTASVCARAWTLRKNAMGPSSRPRRTRASLRPGVLFANAGFSPPLGTGAGTLTALLSSRTNPPCFLGR